MERTGTRRAPWSLAFFVMLAVAAAPSARAQDTTGQGAWTDSISAPQRLGSPDSVRGTIKRDREARESGLAIPGVRDAWEAWFEWKDGVQDEHGLALGLDYTAVILGATETLGERSASGGIVRFFGFWDLIGRGTPNAGAFVWKLEHRHRLGRIAPSEFASTIGYAGDFEAPFSNEGWRFTNLYWRQQLAAGRSLVAGGFLDVTDYVDVYPLASSWTGFMNFAFDTGSAAIGLSDDASFGIAGTTMLNDNFYLLAGLTNANADPQSPFSELGSFFDDREYFSSVELGWTVSHDRKEFDNAHVTLWHLDSQDKTGQPGGWGAAFSVVRYLDDRWMPFLRGGLANDGGVFLERSISAGLGYDVVPKRDLLGFGFNWGRPNKSRFGPGLRDQYTLELFYRMTLTTNFTVTPDIQFIKHPALNPAVDSLWVFGFRARLAI
jgi:porin